MFPKRFSILKNFAFIYLILAFIIRLTLYIFSITNIDFSIINIIKVFCIGLFFDIGSLSYFLALYVLYLLIVPTKFHGSKLDKIITKFCYGLFLFIIIFSIYFIIILKSWLLFTIHFLGISVKCESCRPEIWFIITHLRNQAQV